MKKRKFIASEYSLPTFQSRRKAGFVDLLFLLFLSAVLLFSFDAIARRLPYYRRGEEAYVRVQRQSGLYAEVEGSLLFLPSAIQNLDENARKEALAQGLATFYDPSSALFFYGEGGAADGSGAERYNRLRAEASSDGGRKLFIRLKDDLKDLSSYAEDPEVVEENLSDYVSFYRSAVDEALGFMTRNASYRSYSQTILWTWVGSLSLGYLFAFLCTFFVVPLTLKRGYQTLGMRLSHISLVATEGLNPSLPRFFLRFLFLFLEGVLSPLTLFTPLMLSSFLSLRRYGQTLPDALADTYRVDTSFKPVFFTPAEYAEFLRGEKRGALLAMSDEEREAQNHKD